MAKEFPDQVDRFLSELAEHCPDSTVKSYECVIGKILEFHADADGHPDIITTTHVAEYIAVQSENADSTEFGYVSALSNYIGYTQQRNPDRVKQEICNKLRHLSLTDHSIPNQWPVEPQRSEIQSRYKKARIRGVENYMDHIRNCKYGTRTHAIVEILLETSCRIGVIPKIDRSDLDLQLRTIHLNTSKKHAIPSFEYAVSLSKSCTDALETYCTHNRIALPEGGTSALFRSAHGRLHLSTIRRSVRNLSQEIDFDAVTDVDHSMAEKKALTPEDIRWYSRLSQTE